MKNRFYAGIGWRKTPEYIQNIMYRFATKMEQNHYILRSGGAQGADKAFEHGIQNVSNKVIFRPKHVTIEAVKMAATYHDFWDSCDASIRLLHGRNAMVLLGEKLDNPVRFVICFTKDGLYSGGTGLGLKIAEDHKIPIFNLFFKPVRERVEKFVKIPVFDPSEIF
jgi:hypothetical protein